LNKFSSIFHNRQTPTTASEKEQNDAAPMPEDPAAPVSPAIVRHLGSSEAMGERMAFTRARNLLNQACSSTVESFHGLLKNPATPADVLRRSLEEVIEYRLADAALARAEDEAALGMVGGSGRLIAKLPDRTQLADQRP